ncbi:NAD(P)/FAD-dependent oxidoreductase [Alcaligenaceae bacterium]|nr:NAD(P)/FAD-dependent oxidoreductase [Alcaligenaceae bacterium]
MGKAEITEREEIYDALIVGAGPAGVSCAVWLANLGLRPVLFDAAPYVGGLCHGNPFPDPWTVLLPGADGNAVAGQLARSVAAAGVELRLETRVDRIDRCATLDGNPSADMKRDARPDALPGGGARAQQGCFAVSGKGWEPVRGHTVVLATGVRARGWQLGVGADGGTAVPGIIVGPGGAVARQEYEGRHVAILGGGDNAFENALYVAQRGAASVTIYARNVRAQRQLRDQVPPQWLCRGPYTVEPSGLSVNGRRYDLILVFYGWEPVLDPLGGLALRLDSGGFVSTDRYTAESSVDGVYAIGELTRRQHPCVLTAMADGVVAAKAVQARLERRGT